MFLSSTAIADIWTVDDDGAADFDNIQAAVNAASDGDEIVVMPGTYTGTGSYVVNMNGKALLLRSQEGPQSTIVSGQNQRTVFFCGSGVTLSTIISGFTITQGSGSQGGGIRCEVSSPRIENCRIVNNSAGHGRGVAWLGSSADIGEIINCVFKNNEAFSHGGAVFCDMGYFWMTDCLVRDNVANIVGGVYVYCCSAGLQNTTVCSNTNGQTYNTYEDGECLISETCESCGDINGDNIVDVADLLFIIKTWNTSDIDGDVTFDGIVDVEDLLFIVAAWGNDCAPPQLAACCFGDMKWGWCEFITEEECNSAGGWYMGEGTDCSSVSCF